MEVARFQATSLGQIKRPQVSRTSLEAATCRQLLLDSVHVGMCVQESGAGYSRQSGWLGGP